MTRSKVVAADGPAISIGIVTGSMSRSAGGLFNSVRRSALSLREAGADVGIYALEDEYSAEDRAAWAPLDPVVLPTLFRSIYPYAPSLEARLELADHDILHLHGIWQLQSLSLSRWKRRTRRPVMISPRGMLDPWAVANAGWKKKLVGTLFENRNLREADCLHALNSSEAGSMRAYGLTNPIAVIPNATDLPFVPDRSEPERKKTLLFLGRIHPKKGLTELVEAWSLATRDLPGLVNAWRLGIAGWDDGGHLAKLKRLVEALGVSSSVEFLGPAFGEEKDTLLRSADAFVLPSYSEGLPMSVLEAWAYKLPVLMSAECNLPEGFASGAAFEVSNNPRELAAELATALMDADLRSVGRAGRLLVENCFTWPRIAEQHMAVYRWMMCRGERPACVQVADE